MPGHAESPARIFETAKHLKSKGYHFTTPHPCTQEDVLRVHTEAHLHNVESGHFSDPDTPVLPNIFDHALMAAGAAIEAAGHAMQGNLAFSLMRPPGHHATQNSVMGFCYFNNIAIATQRYLDTHPEHKVAILDVDCHHGNGTENIFEGNTRVLYISLHQTHIFPGTGLQSNGNCINYPLLPGTKEDEYLGVLDIACKKILDFNPDLLGISVGFDTYTGDPLAHMHLEITSYQKIGEMIKELKLPTFAVMEGGYSKDLPLCVEMFLDGLK